jgi:hypothetical protein
VQKEQEDMKMKEEKTVAPKAQVTEIKGDEEKEELIKKEKEKNNIINAEEEKENKKQQNKLVFEKSHYNNFESMNQTIENRKQIVPEPIIKKIKVDVYEIEHENGKPEETEMMKKLSEDDPIAPIMENLYCKPRKISKEKRMEELFYHRITMASLKDELGSEMLGGDHSLKAKVEKDRK